MNCVINHRLSDGAQRLIGRHGEELPMHDVSHGQLLHSFDASEKSTGQRMRWMGAINSILMLVCANQVLSFVTDD